MLREGILAEPPIEDNSEESSRNNVECKGRRGGSVDCSADTDLSSRKAIAFDIDFHDQRQNPKMADSLKPKGSDHDQIGCDIDVTNETNAVLQKLHERRERERGAREKAKIVFRRLQEQRKIQQSQKLHHSTYSVCLFSTFKVNIHKPTHTEHLPPPRRKMKRLVTERRLHTPITRSIA